MTFKLILINRIEKSISNIDKINVLNNRLNIVDQLYSSVELRAYYKSLTDQNKSLELTTELTKRAYWNDPAFKKFKNIFINTSSLANIFFNNSNGTYPDLNLLRHGLDIDTTFDTHRRL